MRKGQQDDHTAHRCDADGQLEAELRQGGKQSNTKLRLLERDRNKIEITRQIHSRHSETKCEAGRQADRQTGRGRQAGKEVRQGELVGGWVSEAGARYA